MTSITLKTVVAIFSIGSSAALAASVISTIDEGGQRTTSASYTMDGSVGGIVGISTVASPPETVKAGYIGQLTEVVSMTETGTPASVNEGATSQLSGIATLDDTTVTTLTGSDIAWGSVTYPFQSVDGNGVLTAVANVYASPVGTVNGSYLGATGATSVQVLGPYASSGIADSWFLQYFGMPPNPNAAPTADADGTGQNNLFKYVAGLDPTNPASVFVLRIAAVPGQPTQKNLMYQPIASGHTYVMQSVTDLVAGVWSVRATSAPFTNGTQVTVTDPYANTPSRFYRVDIYNILTNLNIIIEDSVGDGILDSWRAQYFGGSGTTTNSKSCATCDDDGTGQNNLFKYVAGLDPTNPASVFVLLVQNVTGQPNQKNLLFNPVAGGRTYTPQFRTDMVSGAWATLTGIGGPTTNVPQAQVTVTDMSATQTQKFYRVNISLP
jgi:hypothetical protein